MTDRGVVEVAGEVDARAGKAVRRISRWHHGNVKSTVITGPRARGRLGGLGATSRHATASARLQPSAAGEGTPRTSFANCLPRYAVPSTRQPGATAIFERMRTRARMPAGAAYGLVSRVALQVDIRHDPGIDRRHAGGFSRLAVRQQEMSEKFQRRRSTSRPGFHQRGPELAVAAASPHRAATGDERWS